jgi:hypothetical protein
MKGKVENTAKTKIKCLDLTLKAEWKANKIKISY